MRYSFTYGSVRGAAGNSRPYRDNSPDTLLAGRLLKFNDCIA